MPGHHRSPLELGKLVRRLAMVLRERLGWVLRRGLGCGLIGGVGRGLRRRLFMPSMLQNPKLCIISLIPAQEGQRQ